MEQPNNIVPTRAYDLLDNQERQAVDNYVAYAVQQQKQRGERIALAIDYHIPSEYVRRSKGALAKPLVRAAVAERLQSLANEQDVSPDRIIAEHAAIAFSNIQDYLMPAQFGDFAIKPLDQITRQALSAVKKIESIPSPYGMRTSITMQDKQQSLKVLTELVGLVAPDQPPPLRNYVGRTKEAAAIQQVPEDAYAELLAAEG